MAVREPTATVSRHGPVRVLEIQRARILAALVEVCAERGAGNVTVAHVVERAGVSRRTFYELFADRDACLLAAFDDALERVSRRVLQVCEPDAPWLERMRWGLAAVLDFLEAEPALGHMLIVGSLGGGADALERRRRVLALLAAEIDAGRAHCRGAEPPPLTAEGVAGGVLSILQSQLLERDQAHRAGRSSPPGRLIELTGPLLGMIVLPYMGAAAARREHAAPIPKIKASVHPAPASPLTQLGMRLTYRTVRVLMAIAAQPASSNRAIADAAEISDQGQISKLLARLQGLALVQNTGGGSLRGEPNAWVLTDRGWAVHGAIAGRAAFAAL